MLFKSILLSMATDYYNIAQANINEPSLTQPFNIKQISSNIPI